MTASTTPPTKPGSSSPQPPTSSNPLGVIAFFSRWLLGILLLMAGWFKVFEMGPLEHARALFVEPYADSWIPSSLLWTLGATIPVFELIAGVALVVGVGIRAVSIAVGLLLVIVTYGHVLLEPFYDVTTHVLPRFVLLAAVLAWGERDRWQLDRLLAERRAVKR